MRRRKMLSLVITLLLALAACSGGRSDENHAGIVSQSQQAPVDSRSEAGATVPSTQSAQETARHGGNNAQLVSMTRSDATLTQNNVPTVTERKIIRNANLSVEIDSPAEGQRKIASIAEARGGFVVTSESKQQGSRTMSDGRAFEIVTIEARVPAAQFDTVRNEIRALGSRVTEEKITGQDVTEEYIDLEARVRTQKALEAQFMEIMKQARTVADALEVQSQLAEVRTEIERIEGRRRFLENQSSMSTIKVTLQPPAPLIASTKSGFFQDVKEALGDGVDVATSLFLGILRLIIVLIPVTLFIFLPIGLLARYLLRRQRRYRLAEQLKRQADAEAASA